MRPPRSNKSRRAFHGRAYGCKRLLACQRLLPSLNLAVSLMGRALCHHWVDPFGQTHRAKRLRDVVDHPLRKNAPLPPIASPRLRSAGYLAKTG